MARKKVAPSIKTQDSFEEEVKSLIEAKKVAPTKLKAKRKKDVSLLDEKPAKPKVKKVVTPPRPEHTVSISTLNEITFDKKKFAAAKIAKSFQDGSNAVYISSILYRNMIDFLKREQFYLTTLNGADKTQMKQAIQKDLTYLKTLVRSM